MKTFIVDSFTDTMFKGNPAAVCQVKGSVTDELMLKIAQELGLSETAFVFTALNNGKVPIRYFSPKMEIPLCGHATLAAASVLFKVSDGSPIEFVTNNYTVLRVTQCGDSIEMVFPLYLTKPFSVKEAVLESLGINRIVNSVHNDDLNILLLEIDSSEMLRDLEPDYSALLASDDSFNGVLVTARANDEFDFHSRYFWPWSGTNEDPVTGATHTFLGKYWADKLGKTTLRSFQSSNRSGFMELEVKNNVISIKGKTVVVLEGHLNI